MLSPEVKSKYDNDDLRNVLMNKLTKEDLIRLLFGNALNGGKQSMIVDVTLEKGMEDYEKLVAFKLSEKSVSCIKTVNRRLLSIIPGNRQLSSITKKDAEYVIMKMAETALKGVHGYFRTIHAEFNVFVEWNYLTSNQMK